MASQKKENKNWFGKKEQTEFADIKKSFLKNGNGFIYCLTQKELKNGDIKVEGMLAGHAINKTAVIASFLSGLSEHDPLAVLLGIKEFLVNGDTKNKSSKMNKK